MFMIPGTRCNQKTQVQSRSENEGSFVLPLTLLIPEEPPNFLEIAWGLPEDRLGIGVPSALVDRLGVVRRSVIEAAT